MYHLVQLTKIELCQMHDHYFDSGGSSYFMSHRVRPTQSSFPSRYCIADRRIFDMRVHWGEACSCLVRTSYKDCHRIFRWKFRETPIPHWNKLQICGIFWAAVRYHAEDTCWLRRIWTIFVLGCRYLEENLWLSWGSRTAKRRLHFHPFKTRVSQPLGHRWWSKIKFLNCIF